MRSEQWHNNRSVYTACCVQTDVQNVWDDTRPTERKTTTAVQLSVRRTPTAKSAADGQGLAALRRGMDEVARLFDTRLGGVALKGEPSSFCHQASILCTTVILEVLRFLKEHRSSDPCKPPTSYPMSYYWLTAPLLT